MLQKICYKIRCNKKNLTIGIEILKLDVESEFLLQVFENLKGLICQQCWFAVGRRHNNGEVRCQQG